jgi:hypothetical protein
MRRLCLSADRHAANAVAIGDRGLRSLLTYGAALLLSGSILSAAAPSFALLAVAQGVLGIGIGLLVAIGIAAVVRHTGKEAVRRNARLVALMEQVGAIDDRFRAWRQETGRAFVDRNTAGIRSLQRRGLADPNLDPDLAARALSAMVSRTAYVAFVSGEIDASPDDVLDTVTRLWANALRLSPAA